MYWREKLAQRNQSSRCHNDKTAVTNRTRFPMTLYQSTINSRKGFRAGAFLASWLGLCFIAAAADPKPIIKDKSPDGKFALSIMKDEDGGSASIIDLKAGTRSSRLRSIRTTSRRHIWCGRRIRKEWPISSPTGTEEAPAFISETAPSLTTSSCPNFRSAKKPL